jgi:hypothetical protein
VTPISPQPIENEVSLDVTPISPQPIETCNVSQSLRSRTPASVKKREAQDIANQLEKEIADLDAVEKKIQDKPVKRARTTRRPRTASVPRAKKEYAQQLHEPEITPEDNTPAENEDIAESMADHTFIFMANLEHRQKNRPGAEKKHAFKANRTTAWIFEDFLDDEERVYIHRNLTRAADIICDYCEVVDPMTKLNGWTKLENNADGENDGMRLAANHCLESDKPVYDIIMNLVFMVKEEECIGAGAFACGGSGKEYSITLLLAMIGAKRQRDHSDYDPDLFRVYEDYSDINPAYYNSSAKFNGASMFINFSWNNDHKLDLNEIDNKTGQYRYVRIPAMSIVIISGDLIHAGSANCCGVATRKFFLYLDPHPLCRNLGTFLENGKVVKDNFIWFGDYYKLI